MLQDKFLSVTTLRMDTKKSLKGLKEIGYKFILSNNKPVAVLVDVDYFEQLEAPVLLEQVTFSNLPEEAKKAYEKTSKLPQSKLLNL
ncbi:MAG: hypothetical protein ACK4NC_04055 [Candidatus Gracilibacteria bacterium]